MYQKITIVGNLGRDPEMRYMPDGTAVTNFPVATSRAWKSKDGEQKNETTWFRVAAWGSQAEACNKYLSRGKKVLIDGRLNPDPETGSPKIFLRADGTAGASYDITALRVVFLSAKGEDVIVETSEDDMPF